MAGCSHSEWNIVNWIGKNAEEEDAAQQDTHNRWASIALEMRVHATIAYSAYGNRGIYGHCIWCAIWV